MLNLFIFLNYRLLLVWPAFCFVLGIISIPYSLVGTAFFWLTSFLCFVLFLFFNKAKLRWWWHRLPYHLYPTKKYRNSVSGTEELKKRIIVFFAFCLEEQDLEKQLKAIGGEEVSEKDYPTWQRKKNLLEKQLASKSREVKVCKQRLDATFNLMLEHKFFDSPSDLARLRNEVRKEGGGK